MKKLLSCILVVFILLINVIPSFAAKPTLSVSVSDYYVDPGDVITVNVNLSANSGLGTLEFTVNFNTSEFEYVAGSGSASNLFDMSEFNSTYGAGSLGFVGKATGTVTSGGSVVSLKLRSIKNGGIISLSVSEATDAEENPVSVSKSSVKLNCAHGKMNWTLTQTPTCMVYGKEQGVCSCGYTETREVEPSAHTYDNSTVKTPATCTKTGIQVGTCTTCGQAGAESVIPALGHSYSDWEVTKEPTAETMGIRERVCKVCGDKETQMVAPTGDIVDEPTSDEVPTEPTTEQPVETTEPGTNGYFEIETEPSTEKNSLFGENVNGSDIAFVAVIALAVLVVGVLIAYLILLRKKK